MGPDGGKQAIENMFLGAMFFSLPVILSARWMTRDEELHSAMPFCQGVLPSHGPRNNVASGPLTSENSSQNKPSLSSCFLGSLVIVMKDTANTLPVGSAFAIKTQPQREERRGSLKGSVFLLSVASCSSTDYGIWAREERKYEM